MILEQDFNNAVKEIEMLVVLKSKECIARGWNFYLDDKAPESFSELKERSSGMLIPIASYGSEKTIYSSPYINSLFRFWHDVIHLEENLGFGLNDETLIGDIHIREGALLGLSCLALDILDADTKGQVEYYYKHDEFVDNQVAFVQSCLNRGKREALRVRH